MRRLLPLAFIALAFAGCHKKDDPVTTTSASATAYGQMKVEFSNMVGSQPLILNTGWYLNANGDSFQVSMYKYYVSNITLTTDNGKIFTEPDSYHFINQNNAVTWRFELDSVPAGNYTSIHFLIGVDSAANIAGPKTGVLDPANGMTWDWNTGYIMAKMEGLTPQSMNGHFSLHIAGYSGPNSVLQWVTLPFPATAKTGSGAVPNVHIFSDAAEWFKSPTTLSLSRFNNVTTVGLAARAVSNNYADMFHVDHIDN